LLDWTAVKTFSFNEVAGATLAIAGYNYEKNSCTTGGFAITCSSVNPGSVYNNLGADRCEWMALGSTSKIPTSLLANGVNDSTWPKTCNSNQYAVGGVIAGTTMLWSGDGLPYAAFRFTPAH